MSDRVWLSYSNKFTFFNEKKKHLINSSNRDLKSWTNYIMIAYCTDLRQIPFSFILLLRAFKVGVGCHGYPTVGIIELYIIMNCAQKAGHERNHCRLWISLMALCISNPNASLL